MGDVTRLTHCLRPVGLEARRCGTCAACYLVAYQGEIAALRARAETAERERDEARADYRLRTEQLGDLGRQHDALTRELEGARAALTQFAYEPMPNAPGEFNGEWCGSCPRPVTSCDEISAARAEYPCRGFVARRALAAHPPEVPPDVECHCSCNRYCGCDCHKRRRPPEVPGTTPHEGMAELLKIDRKLRDSGATPTKGTPPEPCPHGHRYEDCCWRGSAPTKGTPPKHCICPEAGGVYHPNCQVHSLDRPAAPTGERDKP